MKHILIVEDDKFLRLALTDNLESSDCVIVVAENGEDAMMHIRTHRPDLILLDLLMPKSDGFYVLEELKKDPEWKTIPVIVLSNLGSDIVIKRALRLGANEYFVKSEHMLLDIVEKAKEYLYGKEPHAAPVNIA